MHRMCHKVIYEQWNSRLRILELKSLRASQELLPYIINNCMKFL